MIRWLLRSAVVAITIGAIGCGREVPRQATESVGEDTPRTPIRMTGIGFATPESVLHDPEADVYLVANINGSPSEEDGNGFISRLAPDGTLLDLAWVDGAADGVTLNAPKGMAIIGDTLYVADITHVRFFHRATGEPLGEIEIPGATFLNDLAAGRDGWLMVSDSGVRFTENGAEDTGSAAVYVISPEGELTQVAAGPGLERPNGLVDSRAHDGLVVVPFGGDTVYLLDEDGTRIDVAKLPSGGLDGVVETSDGRLLASSWGGSAIYAVDVAGTVETVAADLPAPADIGYDALRGMVLVPLFNDNAVVVLPVPPAG